MPDRSELKWWIRTYVNIVRLLYIFGNNRIILSTFENCIILLEILKNLPIFKCVCPCYNLDLLSVFYICIVSIGLGLGFCLITFWEQITLNTDNN